MALLGELVNIANLQERARQLDDISLPRGRCGAPCGGSNDEAAAHDLDPVVDRRGGPCGAYGLGTGTQHRRVGGEGGHEAHRPCGLLPIVIQEPELHGVRDGIEGNALTDFAVVGLNMAAVVSWRVMGLDQFHQESALFDELGRLFDEDDTA